MICDDSKWYFGSFTRIPPNLPVKNIALNKNVPRGTFQVVVANLEIKSAAVHDQ